MAAMNPKTLGVFAAGLLAGSAAAEPVTVTLKNTETGGPMADVRVDQSRKRSGLGRLAGSPYALVSSQKTDNDGTIVFDDNPREGIYEVYTNTRSPLDFEANGNKAVVEPSTATYLRGRIRMYEIAFTDNGKKLRVSDSTSYVRDSSGVATAYIGTYTDANGSKGIYRVRVDKDKGVIGAPELVAEVGDPSFLALDWKGNHLYAVAESANKAFAYGLGNEEGPLEFLNDVETGAGPCHVAVGSFWWPGKMVVSNYGDGGMAAWELEGKDGRIGKQVALFQNTHASQATARQDKPRAHSVEILSGTPWLLAADLGADRVYVYEQDTSSNITPHKTAPWIELPPGRGPRHILAVEAKNTVHLYVLNELSNSVCVYTFDEKTGLAAFVEEVGTLPADFSGESFAAAIKYGSETVLFASNRGHDSIARFQRDPKTGRLTLMECVPCGGAWPRDFAIMPGSPLMLVANQRSNNISAFTIAKDGTLSPAPEGGVELGAPACVVFE